MSNPHDRSPTDSELSPLRQYREQLDQLNRQLLQLIERRGALVVAVMELKRRQGLPVHDPQREAAMLSALRAQVQGPFTPDQVERIFSGIFTASRELAAAPSSVSAPVSNESTRSNT